jgi:hypothetical protein
VELIAKRLALLHELVPKAVLPPRSELKLSPKSGVKPLDSGLFKNQDGEHSAL